jgi:hypothetical protein
MRKANFSQHVYDPQRAHFIRTLLRRHGIYFREKDHFLYVRCPFHGGKSLGFWIHKSGRSGKCWKCQHRAKWEEYASAVGIKNASFQDEDEDDSKYSIGYLKQALDGGGSEAEEYCVQLPSGMAPWEEKWRRIKPTLLSKIGVFRWYDDASDYYRILWPITSQGEIVGYQAGRTPGKYGKYDPKYRASKPLPTDEFFMGLDQVGRDIELVCIVEGAYDLFRGWQNDVPTICNLGASSTWSPDKAATLLGMPRLKHVLVAGDMDDEGKRLHRMVKADLSSHGINVVRIKLPRKQKEGAYHDVGSAPPKWHRKFADHVYSDYDWSGKWSLRPLVPEYGDYSFPKRVYRIG